MRTTLWVGGTETFSSRSGGWTPGGDREAGQAMRAAGMLLLIPRESRSTFPEEGPAPCLPVRPGRGGEGMGQGRLRAQESL